MAFRQLVLRIRTRICIRILVLFSLALYFCTCTPPSNHSPSENKFPQRIRVEGNSLVDQNGKVRLFQGINTSDPAHLDYKGQWNKRYFEEIKNWGANVVRFPVHPINWRRLGPQKYIQLLDSGVNWAEELEMYVIIDWHSIGNLKTEIFYQPYYKTNWQETNDFWIKMAVHYRDRPTVAFFELFNEPTANVENFGKLDWGDWKSMMEQLILAIRNQGAETITLVTGFDWAYDLTPVANNPIEGSNVAYVSHPYPMKRNPPWEEKWTEDWGFVAQKYPVILTEIGFSHAYERGAHEPVIGDENYGRAITSFCERKGISYLVWVFDTEWSPMLIKDWEKFTPTRQGNFFKEILQQNRSK
ncbi:cellulase family glycosylhydrolase [Litoribacter alkaliphilus]|uniref:Cellulase family glycosylhydrolase n=1 Tax=Litoribacter ruber TaxID=702568 RepID=A0AAP2CIW7_9BACT|nr:cellulase family glycosylhydrolase [Litoribacter alkaliphilus]MBS9524514.1 cellulase family glycosylhydrolase [Litoribacter alkaliphilus]